MKKNVAAVLLVRGYRYQCPSCNSVNVDDIPGHKTFCSECSSVFAVGKVYLTDMQQRIEPGVEQVAIGLSPFHINGIEKEINDLILPAFLENESEDLPAVDLTAVGYVWACPECDPWAKKPNLAPGLVTRVTCPRCHAKFPVIEISHKTETHLGAGTLLRHAIEFIEVEEDETEAEATSESAEDENETTRVTSRGLGNWSFYGGD